MPLLDDTLTHLLAMAREAGTASAVEARTLVTEHLESLGYAVAVQRFKFHPSSLLAFPLFGAGLGGLAVLLFPLLAIPSTPSWCALALLGSGLIALGLFALFVGLGWVVLGGSVREDANLIATRPNAEVNRWIVAHLDSKAQLQSMAGRLVAVWIIVVAIGALIALACVRLAGPPVPMGLTVAGAALALLAGALAGRGRLRGTSPGARDNGSGIAAALAAAEASRDRTTGILITGAEEFGMAGARIFARSSLARPGSSVAVNLDTIDDEGRLYVVSHDVRGAALAYRETERLRSAGLSPHAHRLPLGILVDSLPLTRAGLPSITIGRLSWNTLRLIHTPRDTADGLSLAMARRVGHALTMI